MTHEQLQAVGLDLTPDAYARLACFVEQLLAENANINLTAIREPADSWVLHICDSLVLLQLIDALQPDSILDLGTGGGLPGLPLACVRPEIQFTLVDATRKKIDAVTRIAERVGLSNVTPVWGRAEDLAHRPEYREQFGAVTARAVGGLPLLIEYAAGLVAQHGQCWFPKSCHAAAPQVESARNAAGQCALRYVETYTYDLPQDHGSRAVVVYEKRARLRRNLPRPANQSRNHPL